jgi:hypothetical protein
MMVVVDTMAGEGKPLLMIIYYILLLYCLSILFLLVLRFVAAAAGRCELWDGRLLLLARELYVCGK